MYKLADSRQMSPSATGAERWQVVICGEGAPSATVTGADVEGMDATDIIAVGSILITDTANYVAIDDGKFVEK